MTEVSAETRAHQEKIQNIKNQLLTKLGKLQEAAKEHQLVIEHINNVEDTRRCYRMIGGVLVEKTALDLRPVMAQSLKQIEASVVQVNNQLKGISAPENAVSVKAAKEKLPTISEDAWS
eukprot:Platyproteum_vivax@DN16334_c0_g1_i1.p1